MRRHHRAVCVLAAASAGVLGLFAQQSRAATETFDNGGGDLLWSNNTNWNPDAAVDTNDAKFGAVGSTLSNSTVTNIVDVSRTVNSDGYNQFGTTAGTVAYHITQINDGATLSLTGSSGANGSTLYAGSGVASGGATDTSYTYIQNQPGAVTGGTIEIQNALADLTVRNTGSATSGHMSTLDMSKLSFFNANMRNIQVGVGDSTNTRAMGTLWLAFSNNISANSILVGNNNSGTTATPTAKLYFGTNNTINVGSILIGGRATPNSTAGFGSTVTTGSLIIRGAGGIGGADLSVGAQPVGDSGVATSTTGAVLDLFGGSGFGTGTLDAKVNVLTIGRAAATTGTARQGIGTVTYGAGSMEANDVTMGDDNGTITNSTATGTLNIKANAQMVVNNTFVMSKRTGTGTATGYNAVLNIDGTGSGATPAKVRVSGSITDAGGGSTINVTTGGTLQARGLGSNASPIDALTVTNSTVVVDIGGSTPVTNWGWVGNLTSNGGLNANTIGLQFSGTLAVGVFPGIHYNSILGDGFAGFKMAKQPARVTAQLKNNPNSLDIEILTVDSPKWNGNVAGGDWDIATTNNWKLVNALTATNYQEDLVTYSTTDTVLFNDSATGTTSVNVATTVTPNAITVDNPTKPYTFFGPGKITGATGITKKSAASLTIANLGGNDFTGAIDVQQGTLNTGANEVLPNAGTVTASGGVFNLASYTETVGSVNVTGGVVTANTGHLIAGTITASSGTLTAGSGVITTNTLNANGAVVTAASGSIATTTLNMNGSTVTPGAGGVTATTINMNSGTVGAGSISPTTIVAQAGQIDADITGGTTITKNGLGTLVMNGTSTYSGLTSITEGTVRIGNGGALGNTTGVTDVAGAGATSTGALELVGGVSSAEPLLFHGRKGTGTGAYNYNPHIINNSGNNTLSGGIAINTGGTNYGMRSNGGKITISGDVTQGILATGNNRNMFLTGAGEGEISGGLLNPAGTDPLVVWKQDAGTWTLSGNTTYTGETWVQGGTLKIGKSNRRSLLLDVVDGAKTIMTPRQTASANVLMIGTLNLNSTGTLDMNDNDLVVTNGTFSQLQAQVLAGYRGGPDTTATGIISSTSQNVHGGTTILALFANGLAGFPDYPFGSGETIGGNAIVGKYTYIGDTNYDGQVTPQDYTATDSNLGTSVDPGISWFYGDTNFDGNIDPTDYAGIDGALGLGQGNPLSAQGMAAVPEPTSLGLVGLGAVGLLGRRRRKA
jgi:fibronectin-binding autotransporter adhesin